MPQWGLTEELRRAEPWDIPHKWLEPDKVFRDPIHGDVYLTRLERALVDSSPFQRLRRIRQLGTVHLVYPGATHTRFSHALGALRVVQDLLDVILAQRGSRYARHDLFAQWEELYSDQPRPGHAAKKYEGVTEFEFRVAEVTVLARLGSLLHDVCHVAYGHSIEDDLHLLIPHDRNPGRFEEFWKRLGDGDAKHYAQIQRILGRGRLEKAVRAIVLDKEDKDHSAEECLRRLGKYPFVADLVTNTICADLLDYLPRDHIFSGLPVGLGERFMTAFYVVPEQQGDEAAHYDARMALRIAPGGRERRDIATELLKHLRYRYELQERVLVHHAKLAADAMIGKALELWRDELWRSEAASRGGATVRYAIARGADFARLQTSLAEDAGPAVPGEVERDVEETMEETIRGLGDDSLLEYLAGSSSAGNVSDDGPFGAKIKQLAEDVLDRRLYKRAAQAANRAARQRIYELYSDREKRRGLERAAARYAGIDEEEVVIWLPDPDMRLKIAEVLVDFDKGIAPFNEYSDSGNEIYEAHRQLWTVIVFVHPRVREEKLEPVVLARLAELMGVEWDRHRPAGAVRPAEWPIALAGSLALGEDLVEKELQELIEEATSEKIPQMARDKNFAYVREQVDPLARRIRRRRRPRKR